MADTEMNAMDASGLDEAMVNETPAEDGFATLADAVEVGSTEKQSGKAGWYVAHTYSGEENKVKANIEKTIENRHLENQIIEVRVPMQEMVDVNEKGVRKTVQKKMFPGYVLVNMIMNDETWYVVRNTRGVTGFVGPGSKPVPLTDTEMQRLGLRTDKINVDFQEGDTIVVVAGAWKDTIGAIQRIDMGKQTVTINVEMFGRETPVELSFAEVHKMH